MSWLIGFVGMSSPPGASGLITGAGERFAEGFGKEKMKLDWFLIGMCVAIALAFLGPELGAGDGPLHLGLITGLGIAFIFFLHGAALSPAALRSAAANWRLHLLIQLTTFLLFPALGLLVYFGLPAVLGVEIRLGIFFLCALSSTIASSVALTALARGNVPGAVFDATLSGLLGMFLTPMLIGLVAAAGAIDIPILPSIIGILVKLFLPFASGQIARPFLVGVFGRHRKLVGRADRTVILLIIYSAFCDSVLAGLWTRYSPLVILEIFALVAALLGISLIAVIAGSRTLGLSHADEVAAVFCGSQKSLANGAPIAQILFGSSPILGMIMLPLLLYHQLQLLVSSMLARRYAAFAETDAAALETAGAPR